AATNSGVEGPPAIGAPMTGRRRCEGRRRSVMRETLRPGVRRTVHGATRHRPAAGCHVTARVAARSVGDSHRAARALTAAPPAASATVAPDPADATTPSSASAGSEGPAPTIPAEACHSPLDELTQRERIAQLFTVGVSSMEDARRAVHEHRIGGIFLGGDVV